MTYVSKKVLLKVVLKVSMYLLVGLKKQEKCTILENKIRFCAN